MKDTTLRVICIGAGPAGLTAAYHLSKAGASVTVLERDPRLVGGISRTESYKSFRFDVGGHRFFSKSQEIEDLWDEILGEELLKRQRKSRIFYNGKLFDYPLRALDVIPKLGLFESISFMRPQNVPGLGDQSFRASPVRDIFQVLHRKSLGNEM